MRLADIEALPSFALLGPGFGGEPFLLLRDLCETSARPQLVFATFEQRAAEALTLAAGSTEPCQVEFESATREFSVTPDLVGYEAKVERIRAAIAAGDVYQVCLTVRAGLGATHGGAILSRMCRDGAPRFAAWVRLPDGTEFVSASPELFFEMNGRDVRSQPMKGTAQPEAGRALARSEKDQAELAMITDLIRNDLAPVCRPKSVQVARPRHALTLPYAVQTVSDVVGTLDRDKTALDVLAALHPGGSVTGAPKQAALDMIGRLEPHPRGPYCGTLGLLTGDGATFSLLIRTAFKSDGTWVYGVGSGIVFDSHPQAERHELLLKLKAI
jgi:anthranilate/para-aminobenzoate synthase component I